MINRRNFLKSSFLTTGAMAFTPSFNYLLSANKDILGQPPHRFIFLRKSNGNIPGLFALPTFSEQEKLKDKNKTAFEADLDKHELPDWLKCLDSHKENMTVLQGLSMMMCDGGHYSFTGCMGVYKAGRNIVTKIKRATIDYELAKLYPSPFGHIELSLAAAGTGGFRKGIVPGFSAPAPQQRNYCYGDPQTAYDELFKSVTNTTEVNSENTLLDYLKEEESRRLKALGGGAEFRKINNQVLSIKSIRARNNKVGSLSEVIAKNLPKIDSIHANGGPNATLIQKYDAFTDILLASLISGLTNVVTYTVDDLQTPILTLPENKGRVDLHRLGHSKDHKLRDHVKACHMDQVKHLVEKLKSVPEGNGTMFDNTTIIYMPQTGAGHHGPNNEAPMLIMTGKNSRLDMGGRYIRLPFHKTEGHKTIGNWYTTLLNAHGNPIPHYGDLDLEMARMKMEQKGAIKRFLA